MSDGSTPATMNFYNTGTADFALSALYSNTVTVNDLDKILAVAEAPEMCCG